MVGCSLYFHIPFCTRKCHYCHFFVLPDKELLKVQLMQGLQAEWELALPTLSGYSVTTIYFGGGTPSLLGAERIQEILRWVSDSLPFTDEHPEITLEANPENISKELLSSYRKAGINRISIGIQSLDDGLLSVLSRKHSGAVAIDGIYAAWDAGINNISIDLMYDLPGQTLASWEKTLKRAVELPISHLSLYNLTIEPETVFHRKEKILRPLIPDDRASQKMYEMAVDRLDTAGLKQYEISAFARDKKISRHNVGYWTGRQFLGFGPSAFSYWNYHRFRNVANLEIYSKALQQRTSPVDFDEMLPEDARRREMLVVQLRLICGVHLKKFQDTYGNLEKETVQILLQFEEQGLLKQNDETIALSSRGILLYDTIAQELI